MLGGTAYGVVLNDVAQRDSLASVFTEPPHVAPPIAPVLYIKPRTCLAMNGAPVSLGADLDEVEVAPTIALLFGRDVSRATAGEAVAGIVAVCVALDISDAKADFYRPAVKQRCRDGFLPIGAWGNPALLQSAIEIETTIDGNDAHRWSLDRLVRPIPRLIADITSFMTLQAGDMLLVGLPGDAPRARAGSTIRVQASVLPPLETRLVPEEAA